MADERPTAGGAGTNWIALAAAIISAILVSLQPTPLEGLRPAAPQQKVDNVGGFQTVPARLWQDPFGAIAAYVGTSTSDPPPKGLYVSDRDFKKRLKRVDNPTVLMVPLPGMFSPEDIEARRRARYAVLSGLHAQGYVPESETRIGLLALSNTRDDTDFSLAASSHGATRTRSGDADRMGNDRVPFEWFVKASPDGQISPESRSVALLWLNEDHLIQRGKPLQELGNLICTLRPENTRAKSEWVMLGPTTSTTLRRMIIEARKPSATGGPGLLAEIIDVLAKIILPRAADSGKCRTDGYRALRGLKIYNYAATVADADIELPDIVPKDYRRCQDPNEGIRSLNIPAGHKEFERLKISYLRTVGTDESLSCELYAELRRRLKSDDRRGTHVLLISEWDSTYGRRLPDTLAAVFRSRVEETGDARVVFHRASYLRGLDGQSGGVSDNKSSPASLRGERGGEAQTRSDATSTDRRERAVGEGQYDYLRRLGAQIHNQNESLKRDGAEIAAIGVLGSDVYDKLTILQALKPEFPRALFFTTDLDALLLPQERRLYTRNLIVASAFDHRLRDEVQGDSPPFRSSYQASAFLAARFAISNVEAGVDSRPELQKRLNSWLDLPPLFEIGRTMAVRLATVGPPREADVHSNRPFDKKCEINLLACTSVHPRVPAIFVSLPGPALAAIGILAAWAILLIIGICSRTFGTLTGVRKYGLVVFVFAVCVLASNYWVTIANWMTGSGLGEPLFFSEGVSLWPPTLVRVLGATLSVILLIAAFRQLHQNVRETRQKLNIDKDLMPAEGDAPDDRRWRQRVGDWLRLQPEKAPQPDAMPRWGTRFAASLQLSPRQAESPTDNPRRRPQSIESILKEFHYGHRKQARVLRAGTATFAAYMLFLLLCLIFDWPDAPSRSSLASVAYWTATQMDVVLTLFLTFLVVDATLFSRAVIRRLTVVTSIWPEKTRRLFRRGLKMSDADIDDWIDLRFMAERTAVITQLVYYPFIALGILIVARSTIFANFTFSPPILVMSVLIFGVLAGSVMALRRAAEQARSIARDEAARRLIAANVARDGGIRARQLDALSRLIGGLREGAFAPWSSQPVVRAVLVPLLAYSGTALLQLYAFPGT